MTVPRRCPFWKQAPQVGVLLDDDNEVEIGELIHATVDQGAAGQQGMDARVSSEDAAGLIEEGGMIGGKRASHIFLQASTSKYAKRR